MDEYGPDSWWYYFERIIGQKAMCKMPSCSKKILYLNTKRQTGETVPLSLHLRKHENLYDQREKAKKEIEEQRKMAKKEKSFNRAIPEMNQSL